MRRNFAPFPIETVDIPSTTTLGPAILDVADVVSSNAFATAATAAAAASANGEELMGALEASELLLSFSDQGNNLAGIFFQGSLPPYLAFLYFLNYKENKTPKLMGFGFGFLLLFVAATIPTGLISKGTFGCSLADVDWLHGAAESLLTVSNVLIVLGLREALLADGEAGVDAETGQGTGTDYDPAALRYGALFIALVAAIFCGSGVGLGLEAHTPFLGGLGALPTDALASGLLIDEPANALSIPTWAVHFSSVFEFIFAMSLVWRYADTTGNEKWKGVTWGMLPSHASGVAACTYHFFFNKASLAALVTLQAGLTALGNTTLAIACWRLALSNGWTLAELDPRRIFSLGSSEDEGDASGEAGADREGEMVISGGGGGGGPFDFLFGGGEKVEAEAAARAEAEAEAAAAASAAALAGRTSDLKSGPLLAAKLVAATVASAYAVKYGELALFGALPLDGNGLAAAFVFALPPALVAKAFLDESEDLQGQLPSL